MPDANRFHYETPHDPENEITIVLVNVNERYFYQHYKDRRDLVGGIQVSVADEKAVGSYNETFECDIYLDRDAALRLRDWLNRRYP